LYEIEYFPITVIKFKKQTIFLSTSDIIYPVINEDE